MRKDEDCRSYKEVSYRELSLQRQIYSCLRMNISLRRKYEYYATIVNREYYLGQLAALAPLIYQTEIVRHSRKIFEIRPNLLAVNELPKDILPYRENEFKKVCIPEHFERFKPSSLSPREWAMNEVKRVSECVNWELFSSIANRGVLLDDRIIVANAASGIVLGIGGLTIKNIPAYEDHVKYVPYVKTLLTELTKDTNEDILGLCHVLATAVWYIGKPRRSPILARLFGLPIHTDGRGNLLLGKWGLLKTEFYSHNSLDHETVPTNSISSISANKTSVMRKYLGLGLENHPNTYNIVQKAQTLTEQYKRSIKDDE